MSKDFWLNDELNIKKAFIRSRSSCLEEYIVKRDLELGLSKFEKTFDPVILVEKYYRLCSFIEIVGPGFLLLSSLCLSLFLRSIAGVVFSGASQLALNISLISLHLGVSFIMLALFILVIDSLCVKNCIDHIKRFN